MSKMMKDLVTEKDKIARHGMFIPAIKIRGMLVQIWEQVESYGFAYQVCRNSPHGDEICILNDKGKLATGPYVK